MNKTTLTTKHGAFDLVITSGTSATCSVNGDDFVVNRVQLRGSVYLACYDGVWGLLRNAYGATYEAVYARRVGSFDEPSRAGRDAFAASMLDAAVAYLAANPNALLQAERECVKSDIDRCTNEIEELQIKIDALAARRAELAGKLRRIPADVPAPVAPKAAKPTAKPTAKGKVKLRCAECHKTTTRAAETALDGLCKCGASLIEAEVLA